MLFSQDQKPEPKKSSIWGFFFKPSFSNDIKPIGESARMFVQMIAIIFASNDLQGIGALLALQQRGVRVPDDLAVVSFDGTQESRRRVQDALATLWPYTNELFEIDAVDEQAHSSGLGPRWADLRGE